MRRRFWERTDDITAQRAEIRHIAFVKGLGLLSEHHIAVVRHEGCSHARAIAPDPFLLLFGWAINQFLISAALDAECAIGVACQPLLVVVALWDIPAFVVLLDPGIDVLDIEATVSPKPGISAYRACTVLASRAVSKSRSRWRRTSLSQNRVGKVGSTSKP